MTYISVYAALVPDGGYRNVQSPWQRDAVFKFDNAYVHQFPDRSLLVVITEDCTMVTGSIKMVLTKDTASRIL